MDEWKTLVASLTWLGEGPPPQFPVMKPYEPEPIPCALEMKDGALFPGWLVPSKTEPNTFTFTQNIQKDGI